MAESMFQVGGLMSGLNTADIISKLMSIERQPLDRLQEKYDQLTYKKDLYQELYTKLFSFQDTLRSLRLQGTFLKKDVTSSDESVLTATATPDAAEGTYKVKVDSLATATSIESSAIDNPIGHFVDPTVPLINAGFATTPTSGTITVDGVSISVDVNTDSLNDVLNSITSNTSLTATYDNTTDKVTLARASGDTSSINVGSEEDTSNLLDITGLLTSATQVNDNETPADPSDDYSYVESAHHLGRILLNQALSDVNWYRTDVTIQSGSFSINGTSISVNTTDTIQDIIDKINESSANVTARYNTQTDKIELTSTTLGPLQINVDTAGDSSNFTKLVSWDTVTSSEQTLGSNSQIEVSFNGGTTYETFIRSTNTITDAMDYVTLNLQNTSATAVDLNIMRDTSDAKTAVENFVSDYNDLIDYLYTKLNETPVGNPQTEEEKKEGLLAHDSTVRMLYDRLRSFAYATVSGQQQYDSLPMVGVNTGEIGVDYHQILKGELNLDEDTLDSVLAANPNDVMRLFQNVATGTQEGIAQRMNDMINQYVRYGGMIQSVITTGGSIDQEQGYLQGQIDTLNEQLQAKELYYWQKFTTMEQALSNLQAQGAWLSNQISKMS
ncbi:MAG: flagellar filament capping protein FliD [Thermotogae bacterium]|nr:flagellar filament capping protein FliD [Thermotogota bacterium]